MAIQDWFRGWLGIGGGKPNTVPENVYSDAFYKQIGGLAATYDYDNTTYLEKGYGANPDVYAVIKQMSDKTQAIPFYVKKIRDAKAHGRITSLKATTSGNLSIKQLAELNTLSRKAYEEIDLPFPLERPNPLNTWQDILALFKVYIKSTGNCYLYCPAPTDGVNKGQPTQMYVLPAHLVKIVLKPYADLIDAESPIDHFMLVEGNTFVKFPAEQVIHLKYPNPFFDWGGSHLYGLSPIRALLRNLESSNEALNGNVKTMKNSGVFGFISGTKDFALTPEQAEQLKQRLVEMDASPGRLSKIAGLSVPVEFTKLSLTTDELKPFDFLKYDQKQICNVLNWSDKLMNNDAGAKYDNIEQERKRMITDNILPDLVMLQNALNRDFIRKFRGYEDAFLDFDVTELPEMQEDYKKMTDWMSAAPLTPNEKRLALNYETIQEEGMDVVWMPATMKRIDDITVTTDDITKAYNL